MAPTTERRRLLDHGSKPRTRAEQLRFVHRRRRAVALAVIVVLVIAIIDLSQGRGAADDLTQRAHEVLTQRAQARAERARLKRLAPLIQRRRESRAITNVLGYTSYISRGSPRKREVALTFDDGPGPYTPAIVRALRRVHVRATFFQIGRQIPGQNRLERRMVRAGHTLGDHSYSHPALPSRDQLASTKGLIEQAGHYHPCLFRPPYGIVDRRLEKRVRRLGMTTVLWNVDPSDYEDPGARVIVERVASHARPGAIIVLHDGGGMRAQTVAAVPRIVNALRRRGYRFVTVDHLLGYLRAYPH